MPKRIDLTGKCFGRLMVLEFAYVKNRKSHWKCQCDCGNERVVSIDNLKSQHTQSCGCLKMKKAIGNKNSQTHGKSHIRLFRTWARMKYRCYNSKSTDYKNYGGRGITVCDEWKNDFQAFNDWSMANGYNDTLTIDRINVNGNYEPNNCRWVDMRTQENNKRNNHYITFRGKIQTLAQWENELGFTKGTISRRLLRGWSIEKALTTPNRKK